MIKLKCNANSCDAILEANFGTIDSFQRIHTCVNFGGTSISFMTFEYLLGELFRLVVHMYTCYGNWHPRVWKQQACFMFIFVLEENASMNTQHIPSDSSLEEEHSRKHDSWEKKNLMLKSRKRGRKIFLVQYTKKTLFIFIWKTSFSFIKLPWLQHFEVKSNPV